MNKGQLFLRAIEKSMNNDKCHVIVSEEFNRKMQIPVTFSHEGSKHSIVMSFRAYCDMVDGRPASIYEETVQIFDEKSGTSKTVSMRSYFARMKLDDESLDVLTETLDEMEKEVSFKVKDLKKLVKSQNNVEEAIGEKRGRGRPRKELVLSDEPVVKKGRGRPKKEVVKLVMLEAVRS
jgi:hypothetical protein